MLTTQHSEKRNGFAIEGSHNIKELDAILVDMDVTPAVKAPAPVTTTLFDYTNISEDAARKQAQDAAKRIRANLKKAQASYLEIGRDLLSIKAQLAHGEFSRWVEAEFDMTIRTAQNMMNAAELANKHEAIVILPPTAIYKLAAKSTPTDLTEKIAKQVKSGVIPTVKDIEQQIAKAKTKTAKKHNIEPPKMDQKAAKELAKIISDNLFSSLKRQIESYDGFKLPNFGELLQAEFSKALKSPSNMKADRRNRMQEIAGFLPSLREAIEEISGEQEEAFENMPQGLQDSSKGEAAQEIISTLQSAVESIDEVEEKLSEAIDL